MYVTLGEFTIEDVLPFVVRDKMRMPFKVGDKEYIVKMNSMRYRVFCKSLQCHRCGIVGTKFLLQQDSNSINTTSAHFNLYAEKDGELILLTKDHILPISKGGRDYLNNLQTMCSPCNYEKSDSLEDVLDTI